MAEDPILIVTGMSGAGKTTALKALEDLGFEAVDNLPLSLLPALATAPAPGRLAIGIDSRTRAFAPDQVMDFIDGQAAAGRDVQLLFLDCAGDELVRRFSETRRRHPLALDRPASEGVALERELLAPLRGRASTVIDTSGFGTNELRQTMARRFGTPGDSRLTLTLLSFGYARGVPRDADLVFDMRFLANPHWVRDLRPLTGLDPAVRAHVEADPLYGEAFRAIAGLLALLLPGYAREGRAYLTVAFGCTGGRHRSVAVAEAMGEYLGRAGWPSRVVHRDRMRGPEADAENRGVDEAAGAQTSAPATKGEE